MKAIIKTMTKNSQAFCQSGMGLVAISALLFACKGTLIKYIFTLGASVEDVMILRLLFAMPVYVWVVLQGLRREYHGLSMTNIASASGVGIVGYYLASYLDLQGLQTVSAGLERIILYTYPVFVVLLSASFLKRAISLPLCLCIAMTYAGLFMAFYADIHADHNAVMADVLKGSAYVLLSALAFSFYVIGSDYCMRYFSSALFTAIAMLAAASVMTVHYAITQTAAHLLGLSARVYFWCVVTAIIFTVLPSFMMSAGVRIVGSAKAGGVGMIGPVATILIAAVVLGESVSVLQMAGLAIVMLGVYRMQYV
jgi:drug/metabolite transporter (DMT)-like permease